MFMLQNNTGRLHIQKGWKTCFEQFCSHHPRLEWRFVQHCSCNSWFSSCSCRQVFILFQKYRKISQGILYKIFEYGGLRLPIFWPFGFDFDKLCNEYPAVTYAAAEHQGHSFWITCKRLKLLRKASDSKLSACYCSAPSMWHLNE